MAEADNADFITLPPPPAPLLAGGSATLSDCVVAAVTAAAVCCFCKLSRSGVIFFRLPRGLGSVSALLTPAVGADPLLALAPAAAPLPALPLVIRTSRAAGAPGNGCVVGGRLWRAAAADIRCCAANICSTVMPAGRRGKCCDGKLLRFSG